MADHDAVRHYVGMDRVEAVRLAECENRDVADRSPHFGRRSAFHASYRVNVLLDDDGGVVMADLGKRYIVLRGSQPPACPQTLRQNASSDHVNVRARSD